MQSCRTLLNQAVASVAKSSSSLTHSVSISHSSRHSHAGSHVVRHSDVLTLLHKVSALLPRILPSSSSSNDSPSSHQSLEFWSEILDSTYQDITASSARPVRIVVNPSDDQSPAKELVSALLLDPFASQSVNDSVTNRWSTQTRPVTLSYGTSSTNPIQSSFLHRFPTPIDIHEIACPGFSRENLKLALQADVPIFVYNPATTRPTDIPLELANHSSLLVLLAPSTPQPSSSSSSSPSSSTAFRAVLSVDPNRALQALQRISGDHTPSTSAIQQYQDGFVGSGVPAVQRYLDESLFFNQSTAPQGEGDVLSAVRRRTALSQISCAVMHCAGTVDAVRRQMRKTAEKVEELTRLVENELVKLRSDVFGNSDGEIQKSMEVADVEIKKMLNQLSWWRVVRQADEVAFIVTNAVERVWCRDLERQLTWQTGRLAAIQERLASQTFSVLESLESNTREQFPPTKVLENSLQQVRSSSGYGITSLSLTPPIHKRRAQINEYPTTSLHSSAQGLVFKVTGSVGAGMGTCWMGWFGWFTGESTMLLSVEPGTVIGLGLLGSLGLLRLSVGGWEKAKRKWWNDWKRIQEGVGRDLTHQLEEVSTRQLVVVPRTAGRELSEMIEKRKEEIEEAEVDVQRLVTEVEMLRQTE